MSKRTYLLVVGITGAVAAAAVAIITFIGGPYAVAINSSIAVVSSAVDAICSNFLKPEEKNAA